MTLCNPPDHRRLCRFWTDESGAVSVDWIVLTAATVGLAITVVTIFTPQIFQAAGVTIGARITEATAQP